MGRIEMKRTTLMALVSVFLFGVTDMASGKQPSDYFEFRDAPGMMDPLPPMTLEVTDGEIACYARGREFGFPPETAYTGIGKYVLSVEKAGAQHQFDSLKAALSSRTFTPESVIGAGAVFDFSFEQDGRHYEGVYGYRQDDGFHDRLLPFYQIADKVLKDGEPEIKIHPVFTAHSGKDGFVVDLTFRNEGQKAFSIAGPDTWTPDLNRPDLRNVEIGAINGAGTSFYVRLVSGYLSDASRHYGAAIVVKPGEAVTLTFQVPYSAVKFSVTSTSHRITSGSYRFTGGMSVDVLEPAELKGQIRTPMNDVQPVELQAQ
ncbi:hypothetical protein ACFSHT_30670 [Paraburkholderia silviterrae]|uniref:Uncharacterized protein n=1 Tax=Paraburkholderia silviterrae TaxID=2528715 RepID=A0A4R5LXU1_9BURK|nr:hypothetical protein [Paraburkholderia silviterrae]TDG16953.1 hypothetical protein EYW47_39330 [Paraburkholderia silviterrae]